MTNTDASLLARLQEYLELGGLFNPELMDPQKVRALLMEAAAALRRSGEALRRLQEDVDQLKGNAAPSGPEIPKQEGPHSVSARQEIEDNLLKFALHQHMVDDGEYGCPGAFCPGVQRLVAFGRQCIQATTKGII